MNKPKIYNSKKDFLKKKFSKDNRPPLSEVIEKIQRDISDLKNTIKQLDDSKTARKNLKKRVTAIEAMLNMRDDENS